MATFIEQLVESLTTPGASPALLMAANAVFATLLLVFFALFFLTRSLHFVALSFICSGLWYGINWFAAELAVAAENERAADREGTEDSGTEVEPSAEVPDVAGSGGAEVRDGEGVLRKREAGRGTQSSGSTEDEWEKVSGKASENENDKQK